MGVITKIPITDIKKDRSKINQNLPQSQNDKTDVQDMDIDQNPTMYESTSDYASSSEASSSGNETDLDEKLQFLKEIESKIEILDLKVSRAENVRMMHLTSLAIFIWSQKIGKLTTLDVLGASKHRTRSGLDVENLMKMLCELDQVESNGIKQIREKRRSLVRKINNEILPQADTAFIRAKTLVEFTKKVLNSNQPINKLETKSEEQPKAEETEPMKQEKLKYETRETDSSYIVKLQLAENTSLQDIEFDLKNEREMLISCGNCSLPIQVNPRKAILESSTYEKVGNNILILRIPKVRKRTRNSMPRDFNQHQYRPYQWVW